MINQSNDHDKLLAATAEVLRERRNELDLSQEELSSRSGLHRTYISDIELGKRNISLLNLARLAGALGLTASELLQKAQERSKILLANAANAAAAAQSQAASVSVPSTPVSPVAVGFIPSSTATVVQTASHTAATCPEPALESTPSASKLYE